MCIWVFLESDGVLTASRSFKGMFDDSQTGFRVLVSVWFEGRGMFYANEGLHKYVITNTCTCASTDGLLSYSGC